MAEHGRRRVFMAAMTRERTLAEQRAAVLPSPMSPVTSASTPMDIAALKACRKDPASRMLVAAILSANRHNKDAAAVSAAWRRRMFLDEP